LQPSKRDIPAGTRALILSKYYFGVLSKWLEELDIDRYYSIIHFLSLNDGSSQQQICNSLAIDKSAMVKVLDYLIDKGYVVRKVNPKDRREHFIKLTVKGKEKSVLIVKAFEKLDRKMLEGMSSRARQEFLSVLDRLTASVQALPGNELFFNYRKSAKPKGSQKPKKRRHEKAA
jgi:MarR family transcriptional regulator, transcriptional regulator for hemolysin